jgi:hypothetical protein
MTIELTEEEALVLLDLLDGYGTKDDGRLLTIRHVAERNALWVLEGQLEKHLAAPFRSNYAELLERARERVAEKGGPW